MVRLSRSLLAATLAILFSTCVAYVEEQHEFILGFKLLAEQIPAVVGHPLEGEHHDPWTGDGLQRTSNGTLLWRKSDNWTAFVSGSRTWVNGPFGIEERHTDARLEWEQPGSAPTVQPPVTPTPIVPAPMPPTTATHTPIPEPTLPGAPTGTPPAATPTDAATATVPSPATTPPPGGQLGQGHILWSYPWVGSPPVNRAYPGGGEIHSINPDGSGNVQLTNLGLFCQNPSASADGRRIAFSCTPRTEPSVRLYVTNWDGSGLSEVLPRERCLDRDMHCPEGPPRISPDGRTIAYEGWSGTSPAIYLFDVESRSVRRLTLPEDDLHPSRLDWSPDGKRIVFESRRDYKDGIFVVNADGTQLQRVAEGRVYGPSWSPDGNHIAYLEYGEIGSTQSDPQIVDWQIVVVNVDGTGRRQITQAPALRGQPAWSPNGTHLVFRASNLEHSYPAQIHVIGADGTNEQVITSVEPGVHVDPWWSANPDGPSERSR